MHKKYFYSPINPNVENRQYCNWGKVEENQVQPIYVDLELWNTVRRLYFATAVFLYEILIKFHTQWQF